MPVQGLFQKLSTTGRIFSTISFCPMMYMLDFSFSVLLRKLSNSAMVRFRRSVSSSTFCSDLSFFFFPKKEVFDFSSFYPLRQLLRLEYCFLPPADLLPPVSGFLLPDLRQLRGFSFSASCSSDVFFVSSDTFFSTAFLSFLLFQNVIQMILQFLQTVHYILIIHSFGTDDPDGSVHSVSQFISGSYNALQSFMVWIGISSPM